MRWKTYLLTFILALGLVACGKEEAPAPETAAPAAEPTAAEPAAPAEAKSSAGGGYEPAADERVPGITVSKEEQEKQLEEALANTPKPEVPAEEGAKAE
ncbi:MAG TPA: hypothetical protein VK958_02030 [Methylophilus sp.]|uniref:hypothetical protein n=1 Tax=Methylophilus sp. TaxID=29541 RepID=UPI002CC352CF|nr:hypothetical protein [Methylophilus sp.]HSH86006.1 hypothetical protein [Methylophilus sp.]